MSLQTRSTCVNYTPRKMSLVMHATRGVSRGRVDAVEAARHRRRQRRDRVLSLPRNASTASKGDSDTNLPELLAPRRRLDVLEMH